MEFLAVAALAVAAADVGVQAVGRISQSFLFVVFQRLSHLTGCEVADALRLQPGGSDKESSDLRVVALVLYQFGQVEIVRRIGISHCRSACCLHWQIRHTLADVTHELRKNAFNEFF